MICSKHLRNIWIILGGVTVGVGVGVVRFSPQVPLRGKRCLYEIRNTHIVALAVGNKDFKYDVTRRQSERDTSSGRPKRKLSGTLVQGKFSF